MMENLAPAGNREALERAIAAGADAVYLGASMFSARAGAGNFDEDALRDAVRLAHLHHVRVHVTVNTLIKDRELADVEKLLALLADIPVDAVLVQDLGVLQLCQTCFPGLPVHASTQMAIHNATGAAWCAKEGMQRAVLARECSLSEITLAAKQPVEIEVFGHGAQCVGVSGQCLFSSMLGERSGNRGRCAQPCRLEYTYRGVKAAWLSPRDVCMRNDLAALEGAGVASVKIEGRLKRPEYVAQVAGSYRRGMDSLAQADAEENRSLQQIFQRGGFMRGYCMGCEDAGVIAPQRVNHNGVAIGTIAGKRGGFAEFTPDYPLHDGDQLQIRGNHPDYEMIYAGKPVSAGDVATLRLREGAPVRQGDQVYRLTDAAQLAAMQAIPMPMIPVTATLYAMPGEALRLYLSDGTSTVTVSGEVVSAAQKRALTPEDARKNIGKLGDTPFTLEAFTAETADAFVPVSALNNIRREAVEQLTEARIAAFSLPKSTQAAAQEAVLPGREMQPVCIFRDPADMRPGWLNVWYPEDWRQEALIAVLETLPAGLWLQLPTVCEENTLQEIHTFVENHTDKLAGVLLGSVGQLGLSWPVPIAAGTGIPVMNRRAAAFLLERGCTFVTASQELTGEELKTLLAGNPPVVVPALQRTRLMLLHHCPARTALGLTRGHKDCTLCDRNAPEACQGTCLTDRMGYSFPLQRLRLPEGCLVELLNARVTDVVERVQKAGYTQMVDMTGNVSGEKTNGHWNRAVE